MSCRNLETIITELARGQMLEARVKEDALAHMEACKHCAARFADEQTLTVGLRAVAASAATAQTPAHIETALLSAFRQRSATPFVPAIAPARVDARRRLRWSIAAAAAILVVSVFASLRLLSPDSSETAKQKAIINQPILLPSPGRPVEERVKVDTEIQPTSAVDNPDRRLVNAPPFSSRQTGRRRGLTRDVGLNNGQIHNAGNFETATNTNEEIATDFLPLSYGGNLSQFDDGQVVRVELPRSALQSFGLPMNAERAGERVKADVLLGHDGVARAIRFVR